MEQMDGLLFEDLDLKPKVRKTRVREHDRRLPVLDKKRTRRLADKGVAQSDANTQDDWKAEMRAAVEKLARHSLYFTTDDLWQEVGVEAMSRGNTSGLGAIFRGAARDGVIALTDDRRESIRPATHGRPLRVWKSLTFGGVGGGA